jgi:hypothetical protein
MRDFGKVRFLGLLLSRHIARVTVMILPKALTMSNQCHTTLQTMGTPELEVMGVLGTEFLALDELAPGQDWDDLLAAQWGIPCATAAVAKTDRPSWIKQAMQSLMANCFGWSFAA